MKSYPAVSPESAIVTTWTSSRAWFKTRYTYCKVSINWTVCGQDTTSSKATLYSHVNQITSEQDHLWTRSTVDEISCAQYHLWAESPVDEITCEPDHLCERDLLWTRSPVNQITCGWDQLWTRSPVNDINRRQDHLWARSPVNEIIFAAIMSPQIITLAFSLCVCLVGSSADGEASGLCSSPGVDELLEDLSSHYSEGVTKSLETSSLSSALNCSLRQLDCGQSCQVNIVIQAQLSLYEHHNDSLIN